jgi:hypothetical protein
MSLLLKKSSAISPFLKGKKELEMEDREKRDKKK